MFSSMLSLLGSLRRGNFVTNSLRFRSSASAYLNRTPSVAGNRNTWTWSGWVKRGTLGTNQSIFVGYSSSVVYAYLQFNSLDQIRYSSTGSGANLITTAVYRDPSAWYHVVFSYDDTQATASNRLKLYVNGQQITSFATASYPSLNFSDYINSNNVHNIARFPDGTIYFDGYLTDVNFIDGQALTPASFGAIDSSTGVWAPRPYSGTYGTNGFYLKFGNTSSVAALGTDSSGNNNTWTVNNVSLTAGATYDSMIDVPVNYADGGNGRGNYAVLNPLKSTASISNANLSTVNAASAGYYASFSTASLESGKYYWEITAADDGVNARYSGFGIADPSVALPSIGTVIANTIGNNSRGWLQTVKSSTSVYSTALLNNGSSINTTARSTTTGTRIFMVAYDADTGKCWMGYEGVWWSGDPAAGTTQYFTAAAPMMPVFQPYNDGSNSSIITAVNFGQRPFAYTPPAGFRALNTNNLPTPSIVNGANFMAATTYTGNAAARSLSNAVNSVSFQPDLVWIKSRTPGATSHALFDSARGTTKYLSSNTTTGETTLAQSLTAFGADGFSLGTDTTLVNANANSYVAWQWKESITAGLDVVTYSGTLTTGGTVAINHNLGVAPSLVISKSLTPTGADVGSWFVWHASAGTGNFLRLNTTDQANSISASGGGTMIAPTSSVFYTPYISGANASGNNYVAYCFAQIAGFSRFGSYTGNGLADGPFVFCGFRPRWVMIKRTDAGNDWVILDTSRNTYNFADSILWADLANVETSGTATTSIDCLSNGFKSRGAGSSVNATNGTYIFAAFAEVPSKYALAR